MKPITLTVTNYFGNTLYVTIDSILEYGEELSEEGWHTFIEIPGSVLIVRESIESIKTVLDQSGWVKPAEEQLFN